MNEYKYKRIQAIDVDTGEVCGNIQLKNNGSEELEMKIVNIKQAKALNEKNLRIKSISEFIAQNEGTYFHLIYKYGVPLMENLQDKCEGNKSNIHIVRFIQLASYVTFGGKLFDNNGNEIKKSSLSKIWDTSNRRSVNDTYKILTECGYVYETKEDYIMINKELVVKGAIEDFKKLRQDDKDLTYTRVFTKNIQALYEGTEPKARKQLANLFKILPYINFKYNIFCSNPTETNESEIKYLSWTDLAKICGIEENNVTRFKKDLMKLKIYGFNTIGQFSTDDKYYICINPKVYYSGDNTDEVYFLYKSFKMLEGTTEKKTRKKH